MSGGIFDIKADEVEYALGLAQFKYPRRGEADDFRGFGNHPVIPKLFEWTVERGRFPKPDEGVAYLMGTLCQPMYRDDPGVRRRADKLYLDYCRELHTFGLLNHCDLFGQVIYKHALDVKWNVDYLARLASRFRDWWGCKDEVAIQSKMRNWREGGGRWDAVKAHRRAARGEQEWEGKIYELSNRRRSPWKEIAGVWLFGPAHIRDLADEVRGDLAPKEPKAPVAIQMRLEGL